MDFRIDGRDKYILLGDQWSEKSIFHNRAHFHIKKHKASYLSVKSVEASDEGMYRCRVDYKISPTSYAKVNLTIIGKHRKEIIFKRWKA